MAARLARTIALTLAASGLVLGVASSSQAAPPTASGTAITTAEDTVKSGSLPAASDLDGDTVTYSKGSDPAHGAAVVNPNGTYIYAPAANYNGADSFTFTVSDGNGGSNTYTVAITVSPVNDAPTASGTAITTAEDTVKSGGLPAASDIDGDTVTYSKGSNPAHGTVVVNANGTYTYTPAANYNGADSFTFTVSDGNGGSNTYTVAITVSPVNDAPTASGTAITTAEDTVKSGGLPAASDIDGDTVTYSKGSNPAHGTVVVNANGTYTYTPAANYNGTDSFTYTVSDGNGGSNTYTVAISVSPVNDAPTASGTAITTAEDTAKSGSLPAASDIDGDTVTYSKGSNPAHGTVVVNSNGTYTYTPAANYNGTDSFTYTVSDGNGGSNTYTVAVTVSLINDAPVAFADSYTTHEDTALPATGSRNVLTNDTDDDINDTLTATLTTGPAHGTLTLNADGTFAYTPDANFNGTDSFTYTASDGTATSNTATVTLTVTPVNDAPVANNDTYTTNEGTALPATGSRNVLTNDTDIDLNDTLTAVLVSGPTHGTLTLSADGTFAYTPTSGYVGTDSFSYAASDGIATSNTATVTLTVNVLPTFTDPTATITGTAKVGNILTANATSTPTATGVTYEWFSGTTSLSTGPTYNLTDADEGTQIHVVAHLTAAGYQPGTTTSASVGPIATRKAPTITLGASTKALRLGKTTTLTWTSTRATTVTGSGAWTGTLAATGTRKITPQATGTQLYVISATNANGTTRAQIALTTTLPPTRLKVRVVTKAKGTKLRITVAGLAARESYNLTVAGQKITGTATASGTTTHTITTPTVKKTRKVTITATGSLPDRRGTTRTTLRPTKLKLSLDHRTVRASDPVTLTVSHLSPRERVAVTYAGRTIASGRATTAGTYTLTFNPGQNWGKRTVKVTAGKRTAKTTLTVTQRCTGAPTCA